MTTAFAPDSSADDDRTSQLLHNITTSLLDLFDTNETFFISNQSMRKLITGLSNRLDKAVEDGQEDVLFKHWNSTMPQTKKNLLLIGRESPLLLSDGRQMPLLTENLAERILALCRPPEY
ncbi:hypothetical protein [Fibrella aquatilis]|uniref:Uncharacterized protein n=1 Tax=Fibrella aquatilis TaxID=2817059 RepID=A0A939G2H4_9BACT|nr:hypothetical protein [Fibrella aquatilis]MBO0929429.1 hypothetical protein [Fibrella aquatilis]